jgi:hypothetical protein
VLVEREIGPSQIARAMLVVWARTSQNDLFKTTYVYSLQLFAAFLTTAGRIRSAPEISLVMNAIVP